LISILFYVFNVSFEIDLNSNNLYFSYFLSPQLASNLLPVEVRSGVRIATVTGTLLAKDNKFKLQLLTKSQMHELASGAPTQTLPPLNYTWGSIDLPLFMSLLSKSGIYDAVVEQNPNGCIVHIVSLYFESDSVLS